MPSSPEPGCWVVSDGKPGMENQCLGLAEAVGLPVTIKRIRPRAPWRWLPPWLWPTPLVALAADGDQLAPPWPRLVIASGRMSVAPCAAIRRRSGGATFAVQIQSPGAPASWFDLVVVPSHDRLRGGNVVATRGALHRVTADRLRRAADEFAADVAALPRPLVAVLVGGDNGVYRMGAEQARDLGQHLRALTRSGAGLAVTPSRRTGADNERILRDALAGQPAVIWDGRNANPYFGYLGLADAIVVTCDSVSMVSEAVSTGKPVFLFDLPGGSNKFRAFHAGFRADGFTRPLADALASGALEPWSYAPPDDTAMVAAEVLRRLRLPPATGDRNDAHP